VLGTIASPELVEISGLTASRGNAGGLGGGAALVFRAPGDLAAGSVTALEEVKRIDFRALTCRVRSARCRRAATSPPQATSRRAKRSPSTRQGWAT